ncbi:anthranilate synthase family protein [Saccharothrix luteola]|uniref:anthranilate synthase family protein n=1 Tax=Saccharothrix luteola TaxID=2893018 RepID=UPI001E374053|nr:anthranilate synthase family protein [Saccharothrix luteola]MCC8244964.1 anthranilate synthase family protein [Saccharothrix luteola]
MGAVVLRESAAEVVRRVLSPRTPPFALLHRVSAKGGARVEFLTGELSTVDRLADLPDVTSPGSAALVLVPHRQLAERGFECVDDGTPLVVMRVSHRADLAVPDFLDAVPDVDIRLRDKRFSLDDREYARLVRRVVAEEIGRGVGANFVLKRSLLAHVEDYSTRTALAAFSRLLRHESGAYWTFLVHTGTRTLIGASPERHVSVVDGTATMNPISGTYRYPPSGGSIEDVLGFLDDRKEVDELHMVLDEELKMMGRICESGGRVVGPALKAMARVAHTEYLITGRTSMDPRHILRETMFAPTVIGSPLESACRVVARHEPAGRGYYSGVVALIDRDARGERGLDSAIVIRTADVDATGRLRLDVGATLVRHSDPASESAETRAKAAGLLAALGGRDSVPDGPVAGVTPLISQWRNHPVLVEALRSRNDRLARFWLRPHTGRQAVIDGPPVLVVDFEDTFTAMLRHQLSSLGLSVRVARYDDEFRITDHSLVVAGPGPGDPGDVGHPKIAAAHRLLRDALARGVPLLAICLSHQVLSHLLGLRVLRRPVPGQGEQKVIDFFGRSRRCGFYNTFAACADTDRVLAPLGRGLVELSRDPVSGEVHGMRGRGFASVQFHPESVLTVDGIDVLDELTSALMAGDRRRAGATAG